MPVPQQLLAKILGSISVRVRGSADFSCGRGYCDGWDYASLKRFDLTPDRRQAVQQSLAESRKLKKYFRYKIGTVTKEFRPFKIFVLVAHADSWDQCFAQIAKRTSRRPASKKRGGPAGATGKEGLPPLGPRHRR